ncbi:MAG: diguanylate cyclase [Acetobacteraceae bacterium]
MAADTNVEEVASRAWETMFARGIARTPRHYELFFALYAGDRPVLAQRLNALLVGPEPVSDVVLDELYREFLAVSVDVETVRDGSSELSRIADEMAVRVSTERAMVDTLGQAFGHWATTVQDEPTWGDLRRAAATLGSASAQASERLGALQQLFAASVRRISDLRQRLVQAEQEATRDALTGLSNRRMFDIMLRRSAMQAAVERSDLSLMLLDIDHFKRFNDTYGHTLGDNVLRLVAGVLTEHARPGDTTARYGGEEFAIILPNTGLDLAMAVGEQIRRVLEKRQIMNRNTGRRLGVVTCSIGMALYRYGEPVSELLDRADHLLYRAKDLGRNRVVTETPR